MFAERYVVGLLSMERSCRIGVSKNQANAAWKLVLFRPCNDEWLDTSFPRGRGRTNTCQEWGNISRFAISASGGVSSWSRVSARYLER